MSRALIRIRLLTSAPSTKAIVSLMDYVLTSTRTSILIDGRRLSPSYLRSFNTPVLGTRTRGCGLGYIGTLTIFLGIKRLYHVPILSSP
jgi:hypothetical protein